MGSQIIIWVSDIGKHSIRLFNTVLYSSKCVVWNGPLGVTEFSNFSIGSRNVMKFLSILDATTIIGGGDTACCCEQFDLQDEMTHVSTGGVCIPRSIRREEVTGYINY